MQGKFKVWSQSTVRGGAFAGKGEEVGDRRRTQRGGHRGIAGHRADTRGTQRGTQTGE